MRKFATISPTEAIGKKTESWQDFLKGGYCALGLYNTDFTRWSLDKIIEDIKKQRFKVDDKENQKEIDSAIKAHSNFDKLNIGDVIASINNRHGLFGIGIIKSNYKFKKHLHPSRTNDSKQVPFYSHYRDVDWIITDYHKTEEIDFENESQWQPYGTINIRKEIPLYITKLLNSKGIDLNLEPIDWKQSIIQWASKRRTIKKFTNQFLTFFENVIRHTYYPERAFLGTNKITMKAMIGHLYLGAYIHSGNDKGISLLVDKELTIDKGITFHPVKSTLASTSKFQLFWLYIDDLSNLHKILTNEDVWYSFKIASKKIIDTPQGKHIREKEKLGKVRLDILSIKNETVLSEFEYQQKLEKSIIEGKKLSKTERKLAIKKFPEIPEKITTNATAFKRNPYVVIETLDRANGICDSCNKDAPFVKIKDETPFLEVHHVHPLSEGGKDTLGNTVALCPNCHREAHLGIKRDQIKQKLIQLIRKYEI